YSRTILLRVKEKIPKQALDREFQNLSRSAANEFRHEGWAGKPMLAKTADLRYRGQGFELNVAYGPKMHDAFHAEHKRRYGYSSPEREVEIVTVRLRAKLAGSKVALKTDKPPRTEKPNSEKVWFDGKFRPTAIYARESLPL